MWKVTLVKPCSSYTYPNNYFPRLFRYKRDALELQKEVKSHDGKATVTKIEKVKRWTVD